jgi:hypothetical protein
MQKLNFATKVTVLGTAKLFDKNTASGAVVENRKRVQAEINKYKVQINRDEFVKSSAEKDVLRLRKADSAYKLTGTVMMPFNNRG